MKNYLCKFEITGVIVNFLLAILLHNVYEISNGEVWSIIIGSINESIWEHIKIFSMPYIFWAAIELAVINPPFRKFIISKTIGLYSIIILMIVFYYSYTYFTGRAIFFIDILNSILILCISYFLSYKINMSSIKPKFLFSTSIFLLAIFFVMYISFTICPPKTSIFKDPITNTYGIAKKI